MNRRRPLWPVLLLLLAGGLCFAAPEPVSGRPLPAGGDGAAPLAAPDAYRSIPLGAVRLSGGGRPDLLVAAPVGLERGIFLFPYREDDAGGTPVFGPPRRIPLLAEHGEIPPPWSGFLLERDGRVTGCWLLPAARSPLPGLVRAAPPQLLIAEFDRKSDAFRQRMLIPLDDGFPARTLAIAAERVTPECWTLFLLGGNRPAGAPPRPRGDRQSLYDGAGVYRGTLARNGLFRFAVNPRTGRVETPPQLLSATDGEILGSGGIAPWNGGAAVTNAFGAVYWFHPGADGRWITGRIFTGETAARHPTHGPWPVAYPASRADAPAALVLGGEGALFHYRPTGRFRPDGNPVFAAPEELTTRPSALFAGTLAVPEAVDWNGDGKLDLIVGNSEGRVLFFANRGTDRRPDFAPGVPLTSGGEAIHIQPGYYGIQGPQEARWGYSCPTVADWDGDGLPDLLLSDSTARHRFYRNLGPAGAPRLAAPKLLKVDGLELHGTWRVKPGVGRLGDHMVYLTMDDDNDFHLYRRLDDENLLDGGKLRWENGAVISGHVANRPPPGQTGRGKITLCDWDGDGRTDILFGAMRRHVLPGPETGLPWSRFADNGMQVLFLRNVGTDAAPRFAFPRQFRFRGRDLFLGSHTSAPAAARLGGDGQTVHLLVGTESGRIYWFDRRDLDFAPFAF